MPAALSTMPSRAASLAAAAALALTCCGGPSPSEIEAGCGGSGDIVVGVIAPRSGAVAALVTSFSRGAQQAADDIDAKSGVCGRRLRLAVKDNAGDPSRDAQLARQLVEREGAPAVVLFSDDDFAVVGHYLQQKKVLVVGAFTADALDDPVNAVDTFSVAIPDHLELEVWKSFLFSRQHAQRPTVLYETASTLGRRQSAAFCDAAQVLGTPCVDTETTALDTIDVRGQLARMRTRGADSILLEGFGVPLVKTISGARAAGIAGPILGTGITAISVNLIARLVSAEARHGYGFVDYRTAVQGDPEAGLSLATSLRHSGPITEPLFLPMLGYDAVQLIARGWSDAHSLNAAAASAAIEKVNTKLGQGPFTLHDVVYSAGHHEPQLQGWLQVCVAEPLDDNGLARPAS